MIIEAMNHSFNEDRAKVVIYQKFTTFRKKENSSYLSATLHSYSLSLWLNYGYGKKKVVFYGRRRLSGKTKKERDDYEFQEQQPVGCSSGS